MSSQNSSKAAESAADLEASYPKDFGIFYPTGCLVVGFPTESLATAIQSEFVTEGYSRVDCAIFNAQAILLAADHDLKLLVGLQWRDIDFKKSTETALLVATAS